MKTIDEISADLFDALDALDEVRLHEISGSSPAMALEAALAAADRAAAALKEHCDG